MAMIFSYSSNANYNVSNIPKELKENARSVVRYKSTVLEIHSRSSATLTYHYAITVLNRNGIWDAQFQEYYDKFSRIPNNIKITLYDAYGNTMKKVKQHEIINQLAYESIDVDDARIKYYDPETNQVPFTIEIEYTKIFKGILSFPVWSPGYNYNVSIENANFTVICPENYNFRYFEKNMQQNADITTENGKTMYKWKISNFCAIKEEPFCLPKREFIPMVIPAPSDFEINGYTGNCNTWKNLGKWNLKLLQGRNDLSEDTKVEIRKMISDSMTTYEKTKVLYNYLQDKTRYVSIQEGIGGWQPFKASFVDKYSFGDCKALSFYLKCLLEEVGVNSYYSRIYAGSYAPDMIKDFPSNQFNHVMLCVPNHNDTIWLECTSQTIPFGYIGTFTDDREVLLITEEGGKLAHTRIYTQQENSIYRNTYVQLNETGNSDFTMNTSYKGIRFEDPFYLTRMDKDEKRKTLYQNINIPNFELSHFTHEVIKDEVPSVNESIWLTAGNYASKIGDRLLVPLNQVNKIEEKPKNNSNRKSDIFIRRSTMDIDTIVYEIPENYILDKSPENISISNLFGEYSFMVRQQENKIIYTRSFKLNKGTYLKENYPEFVDFFDQVCTADELKMVLKKK